MNEQEPVKCLDCQREMREGEHWEAETCPECWGNYEPPVRALARCIGEYPGDISPDPYSEGLYQVGGGRSEYWCLEDYQAQEEAKDKTRESAWCFLPSFWGRYTGLNSAAINALSKVQGEMYEDFSEVLQALCGSRFEEMITDAVNEDGRGRALATYDGEEWEQEEEIEQEDGTKEKVKFYIYKVN